MARDRQPMERGRRFRAVDVLTGTIDRAEAPKRARKQISAYLSPEQVRSLGELHARLNSTTERRVEKSEIVGLALDLLTELIRTAEHDAVALTTLDAMRAYGNMIIGTETETEKGKERST